MDKNAAQATEEMMVTQQIHHELVGKFPALDPLRDSIDEIVLRYETERSKLPKVELGLMSETDRKLYFADLMSNATHMQIMADVVVIQLFAEHVFGLKADDFSSMDHLISAMNSLDYQIRVK
jgi:hypothetical protein